MAGSRYLNHHQESVCIFGVCFPHVVFAFRHVLFPYGDLRTPGSSNLDFNQPSKLSRKRKILFCNRSSKSPRVDSISSIDF